MTLRPLFYSDQDCRDRLKPGKPMFFNVYLDAEDGQVAGQGRVDRRDADYHAFCERPFAPYRIVVKAKPTPSPEENAA